VRVERYEHAVACQPLDAAAEALTMIAELVEVVDPGL
jgi:hypothetical protein